MQEFDQQSSGKKSTRKKHTHTHIYIAEWR